MSLQEQFAALEVSHTEEVEKNKKCERQIDFLYNKLIGEQDNLKKSEEEKESLKKVNEAFRKALQKTNDDLESARLKLSGAKIQVNKLNQDRIQLTNDLQFVGDIFGKASSDNESLKTQLLDSEREVQNLKQAIEELNRQKVGHQANFEHLQVERQRFSSDQKLTNLELELKLLVCTNDLSTLECRYRVVWAQ